MTITLKSISIFAGLGRILILIIPPSSTRFKQLIPSDSDNSIMKILGEKSFSYGVHKSLKKISTNEILGFG
jgi:hypothetical protein